MTKKGKKGKKEREKKLSLSDRLANHWRSRRWDAFVALYLRERARSLETQWASRWHDALYNCMTSMMFVDKDYAGVRMILDVVRDERAPLDTFLPACAEVVACFLRTYDGVRVSLPALNASDLPYPYSALLAKMEELGSERGRTPLSASVDKLASQFEALPKAKNMAPYTNLLKTARLLEELVTEPEVAPTFRAVRVIIELIRELRQTEKKNANSRNLSASFLPYVVRDIPPGTRHAAVRGLWGYFCRLGERRFGTGWGNTARAAGLLFLDADVPGTAKRLYERMMKMPDEEGLADFFFVAHEFHDDWTEHERYILCWGSAVLLYNENLYLLMQAHKRIPLLWLKTLAGIARRWRAEYPWTPEISNVFDSLLMQREDDVPRLLSGVDFAYGLMSPRGVLLCLFLNAASSRKIHENVAHRTPLSLSVSEYRDLVDYFTDHLPRANFWVEAKTLLDGAEYVRLLSGWFEALLADSADAALDGEPRSSLAWNRIDWSLMRLVRKELPEDSPIGRFCALCEGETPGRLSTDEERVSAFFAALPGDAAPSEEHAFGGNVFLTLLLFPKVAPDFLLRLFAASLPRHLAEGEWMDLARLVQSISNTENRMHIARGMHEILKKTSLKKDRETLALFALLGEGRALPKPSETKEDDDDDDDELERIIARLFVEEAGREAFSWQERTPPDKRNAGKKTEKKTQERLGRLLFDDDF